MDNKKILWGVCGIGNGHTFRQLPLINHFSKTNKIVIFAYENSYQFYTNHFKDHDNIDVLEVAVSFYVGNKDGLDFEATANHPVNQGIDFTAVNTAAMAQAQKIIGKPDLVISDYEPVSAQYAYAYNARLVTVDQQSKYLVGEFPDDLNGSGYKDEVERLMMFFPKADKRIACSFFDVARLKHPIADVDIVPPTLNPAITSLKRIPDDNDKIFIIYLSSQQPFGQSVEDIISACHELPNCIFHIFVKGEQSQTIKNTVVHNHGDGTFHDILAKCHGIISTAGHSLLSEAMYLNIPVYAIPLPLYEQQMNAYAIGHNSFGLVRASIDSESLQEFVDNINTYKDRILKDETILLREKLQDDGTNMKDIPPALALALIK